jgi:alpha-glucosidase (family GH31 glycosyl hydrolase)
VVQDLIDDFRARDIPCDAVYLDINSQRWTNSQPTQPLQLSFNPALFTNVPANGCLCRQSRRTHLVPIIEPLLTTNDPLYADVALINTRIYQGQ